MKKVAVTGGIASGKSTVCQIFQSLGAIIFSADEIVHQLLSPQTDLGNKIRSLLGDEIVVDDRFDRLTIAQKVFSDPRLLAGLESLIHPEVLRVIKTHYIRVSQHLHNVPLFVVEIPLLFESSFQELRSFFDFTILVEADEKICRERFCQKGFTEEEYQRRSYRFIPDEQKKKLVDFRLQNKESMENLQQEVTNIFKHITSI